MGRIVTLLIGFVLIGVGWKAHEAYEQKLTETRNQVLAPMPTFNEPLPNPYASRLYQGEFDGSDVVVRTGFEGNEFLSGEITIENPDGKKLSGFGCDEIGRCMDVCSYDLSSSADCRSLDQVDPNRFKMMQAWNRIYQAKYATNSLHMPNWEHSENSFEAHLNAQGNWVWQ